MTKACPDRRYQFRELGIVPYRKILLALKCQIVHEKSGRQVKPTSVGYLIWSKFPVKVYFDRPPETAGDSASLRRFQQWVKAVLQAIQEWRLYLPLVAVDKLELADIIIKRSPPPMGTIVNPETSKLEITRARSAQTQYKFYSKDNKLYHRMTVLISPGLSESSILSAARHELGHALGIWGHSLLETDALYFSQVRNTPPISVRDINTLKKVYQQPTRLGW